MPKIVMVDRVYHVAPNWDATVSERERLPMHYSVPVEKMSNRTLRTHLCRGNEAVKSPILCKRSCPSISVCRYGQEYLKRRERHDIRTDHARV